MKTLFGISILFLSACTTGQLVQRRYTPTRGGIASYRLDARARASAEEAEALIRDFCGGDYAIKSETHVPDTETIADNNNVDFECKASERGADQVNYLSIPSYQQ